MARRGFTLIEMLVVVVILLLLAAILMPVLKSAEEKGRQTACESNLAHLAKAFALYRADYEGRQPPEMAGSISLGNVVYWPALINTYVNSTQMFICPSEPKRAWSGRPDDPNVCYALNFLYMNGRLTDYGGAESLVWEPHDTVLLVDSDTYVAADPQSRRGAYAVAAIWGRIRARHNGMVSIAWEDGHVNHKPKSFLCDWRHWDACNKPYDGDAYPPLEGNCP